MDIRKYLEVVQATGFLKVAQSKVVKSPAVGVLHQIEAGKKKFSILEFDDKRIALIDKNRIEIFEMSTRNLLRRTICQTVSVGGGVISKNLKAKIPQIESKYHTSVLYPYNLIGSAVEFRDHNGRSWITSSSYPPAVSLKMFQLMYSRMEEDLMLTMPGLLVEKTKEGTLSELEEPPGEIAIEYDETSSEEELYIKECLERVGAGKGEYRRVFFRDCDLVTTSKNEIVKKPRGFFTLTEGYLNSFSRLKPDMPKDLSNKIKTDFTEVIIQQDKRGDIEIMLGKKFLGMSIVKWKTYKGTIPPDALKQILQSHNLRLDDILRPTLISESKSEFKDFETWKLNLLSSAKLKRVYNREDKFKVRFKAERANYHDHYPEGIVSVSSSSRRLEEVKVSDFLEARNLPQDFRFMDKIGYVS